MNALFLCQLCIVAAASRNPANTEKEHWIRVLDDAVVTKYTPSTNHSAHDAYWFMEEFSKLNSEEKQLEQCFRALVERDRFHQVTAAKDFTPYPQGLLNMVKGSIERHFPDVDTSKVGIVSDSKQLIEASEKLIRAALKNPNFSFGEPVKLAAFRLFYLYISFKKTCPKRLLPELDVSEALTVQESSTQTLKELETPPKEQEIKDSRRSISKSLPAKSFISSGDSAKEDISNSTIDSQATFRLSSSRKRKVDQINSKKEDEYSKNNIAWKPFKPSSEPIPLNYSGNAPNTGFKQPSPKLPKLSFVHYDSNNLKRIFEDSSTPSLESTTLVPIKQSQASNKNTSNNNAMVESHRTTDASNDDYPQDLDTPPVLPSLQSLMPNEAFQPFLRDAQPIDPLGSPNLAQHSHNHQGIQRLPEQLRQPTNGPGGAFSNSDWANF